MSLPHGIKPKLRGEFSLGKAKPLTSGAFKVHETKGYYRVRQKRPMKAVKTRTLTLSKKKGYKAIRQYNPKTGKWETQSVLIEKRPGRNKKFAEKKAKELA